MKIDVASRDKRYEYLCTLLNSSGYTAQLVGPKDVLSSDVLVLPIKKEHTEKEIVEISKRIPSNTKVLYGGDSLIRQFFKNQIVDYSKNELFLKENARITAEAFISFWQNVTGSSFYGKKILISGYGRIGKYLSKMLFDLGAKIYVFARRDEIKNKINSDGFYSVSLDFATKVDSVINTVPAVIFRSELIMGIPKETHLFELASSNGFEETERVIFALGLPGKILPKSAANAIFSAIKPFLD